MKNINFVISFFIGRSIILGLFNPFIPAYLILLIGTRRDKEFYLNSLIVSVGLITSNYLYSFDVKLESELVFRNLAIIIIIVGINVLVSNKNIKLNLAKRGILNFIIVISSYLIVIIFRKNTIFYLISGVLESSISYFLTFLMASGIVFLQGKYRYVSRIKNKDLVSLLFIISIVLYGLKDIEIYNFNLLLVSLILIILMGIYVLSTEYAILTTFILLFVPVMFFGELSTESAMILMYGTLVSSSVKKNKLSIIISFLTGLITMQILVYFLVINQRDIINLYYNFIISSFIFYVLPYDFGKVVKNSFTNLMYNDITYISNYNNNNLELINIGINEGLEVFTNLSLVFKKEYIKQINKDNNREGCEACISNKERAIEGNYLLYKQYEYLYDNFKSLISNLNNKINFKESIEKSILIELKEKNIKVKKVLAFENENRKFEVLIKLKEDTTLLHTKIIDNIVKSKVEKDMEYVECKNLILYYKEKFNIKITHSTQSVKKTGSKFSGDTHSIFSDRKGGLNLTLCDGMGSGEIARKYSTLTIESYESFIKAGFDREKAISLVNSVLLINDEKEFFSSLDTILIDRYEKTLHSFKVGASATYIIRNKEIKSIESKSLPIGIINNVEVDYSKVSLEIDDIIIMATDGLIESNLALLDKKSWLLEVVNSTYSIRVEDLSRRILSKSKEIYGENIKDDSTVIVIKVKKS